MNNANKEPGFVEVFKNEPYSPGFTEIYDLIGRINERDDTYLRRQENKIRQFAENQFEAIETKALDLADTLIKIVKEQLVRNIPEDPEEKEAWYEDFETVLIAQLSQYQSSVKHHKHQVKVKLANYDREMHGTYEFHKEEDRKKLLKEFMKLRDPHGLKIKPERTSPVSVAEERVGFEAGLGSDRDHKTPYGPLNTFSPGSINFSSPDSASSTKKRKRSDS